MRKSLKAVIIAAALALAGSAAGWLAAGDGSGQEVRSISKEVYYDKTLAGIIGQVGGVLTGYEFVSEDPLPDEWFGWIEGPYSGSSAYIQQPQNDRLFEDRGQAVIGSDDDYHIDFFNQHILDVHGPNVSNADIKAEWLEHDVSDWGGGGAAMASMRTMNLLPPLTGKSEFNDFYWVTEAYIENDTLGMTAPGMPVTAAGLTEKFASVTGEYDAVLWAKLQGTMYSLAYFEQDARTVLDQAAAVLPRNSWPYQIYMKVKALHDEKPDDWRWAQSELRQFKRLVYGWDNIQVIPDINNALALLAILYGNNDYTESAKIASLAGYDADCTASFVMGLMGIIKGMDGVPQEVKFAIYADGKGIYVNDPDFTPHLNANYPDEQKLTDIASLYQKNAERMIVFHGGSTESSEYRIPAENLRPAEVVIIPNADFEQGSLEGWTAWNPKADDSHIYAQDNGSALSGDWKGRIDVNEEVQEGKLYVKLNGLKKGQTYQVKAYLTADRGLEARLFADEYGGPYRYASVSNRTGKYASRTLTFTAGRSTAIVGLHVPPGSKGELSAALDDLTVEPIVPGAALQAEAEDAEYTGFVVEGGGTDASGGQFIHLAEGTSGKITFEDIEREEAGEYRLVIRYANPSGELTSMNLAVNGDPAAAAWFPPTGRSAAFSDNRVELPVVLQEGRNSIELSSDGQSSEALQLDRIEIMAAPHAVYLK
ncbi:ADP-ribosylglycohydrolase family protein [Paenibacillus pinistramenti]|uniref:ADP-ribosylglycohydrolase family protein n=1 Tax=Paenibacillus pinistramenti TaxID=1768003 RepID=UPI001396ADD8|nr:ADP-ribosylglycohydrolase family protein [Paenibacillus pinistramenti]